MSEEKIVHGDRRELHRGRVVTLVERRVSIGEQAFTFEVIEHPGVAAALPLLPDGRFLLLRQYRYAVRDWLWEIPAGTLNPGEAPEACARREIKEETGWETSHLVSLGSVVTAPGFSDIRVHLFAAALSRPGKPDREAGEILEVYSRDRAEIEAMLKRGELIDAKTLVALYRFWGTVTPE